MMAAEVVVKWGRQEGEDDGEDDEEDEWKDEWKEQQKEELVLVLWAEEQRKEVGVCETRNDTMQQQQVSCSVASSE